MKELIQVELYKMRKKYCFLIILAFNAISILYGLGILLNWSWVSFNGNFDLIQYMGAIWQLLFLIGLPLIFFMYIGASILGGEKSEGQILLEITKVADRKKLVMSKILAILFLILFYFITNIIVSSISYIFLVRQTTYITVEWVVMDKDNINLLITCLFGCVYIIISVFATMYMSIKYGAVIATITGIAIYAGMSLVSRVPNIRMCVPGYFALTTEANINLVTIIQQIVWCSVILFILLYLTREKICKIDL